MRTLLNVSIAVILMGAVVLGVNTLDTQRVNINFIRLLLSVLAGVFIYFGTIWMLGEISEGEKATVSRFCHKIIKRFA